MVGIQSVGQSPRPLLSGIHQHDPQVGNESATMPTTQMLRKTRIGTIMSCVSVFCWLLSWLILTSSVSLTRRHAAAVAAAVVHEEYGYSRRYTDMCRYLCRRILCNGQFRSHRQRRRRSIFVATVVVDNERCCSSSVLDINSLVIGFYYHNLELATKKRGLASFSPIKKVIRSRVKPRHWG